MPPPPEHVPALLADLERFIHDESQVLPPLVKIALIHQQFETIHPYLDGNGRIGRLLIAALLEHWRLLPEPLMYLSGYLKQHQAEYYRRLSNVRLEGDWVGWIAFFLEGVTVAAQEAERNIVAIATLLAADRRALLAAPKAGPSSYRLFEMLPMMDGRYKDGQNNVLLHDLRFVADGEVTQIVRYWLQWLDKLSACFSTNSTASIC